MEEKLEVLMEQRLKEKKYQLAVYVEQLKGLSPLRKLSQGYAFFTDEQNKQIKTISKVKKGQRVKISVMDGDILATVEQVDAIKRK